MVVTSLNTHRFPLIILLFILLICRAIPARHIKRTWGTPAQKTASAAARTKESAMTECIEQLETGLSRLADAMDDYDFDRIHQLLFSVYGCYTAMDSVVAPPLPPVPDTQPAIVTQVEARKMKTQFFIDSFITVMEKKKGLKFMKSDSPAADSGSWNFKPVIRRIDDSTLKRENRIETPLFEKLTRPRSDSSVPAVVVPDTETVPRNLVSFEVEKLREHTADIHRFFDAGEFSMSRSELEWLIERVSKVTSEIITYTALQDRDTTNSSNNGKGVE